MFKDETSKRFITTSILGENYMFSWQELKGLYIIDIFTEKHQILVNPYIKSSRFLEILTI